MRRHKGLKRTNPTAYREKVTAENQRLWDTFPSVFDMHLDGKLDEKFFNMLKLRNRVEKGELTEDEASKIVGQMLFDQYVAPVVGTVPPNTEKPLSYEKYYEQFDKNA
jgi:hypothetical protein